MSDEVKLAEPSDAWHFMPGPARMTEWDPDEDKPTRSPLMIVERVDRANGALVIRRATRWERFVHAIRSPIAWLRFRWYARSRGFRPLRRRK